MTDIFSKESIKNQICVMLQKESMGRYKLHQKFSYDFATIDELCNELIAEGKIKSVMLVKEIPQEEILYVVNEEEEKKILEKYEAVSNLLKYLAEKKKEINDGLYTLSEMVLINSLIDDIKNKIHENFEGFLNE